MPGKPKNPCASQAFKARFSFVCDPLGWVQEGGSSMSLKYLASRDVGQKCNIIFRHRIFSRTYLGSYTDGYYPLMSEMRR